jgi:hypothetical protein
MSADALIDNLILRHHDHSRYDSPEIFHTYLLIALLLNLPQVLRNFYHQGLDVSASDLIGNVLSGQHVSIKGEVVSKYTWLTFAIHLGRASCVKVFIEDGVDPLTPDSCGRTGLQMAQDQVHSPHPRATSELHIWPYQPPQRFVSFEDDHDTLAVLQSSTACRQNLVCCPDLKITLSAALMRHCEPAEHGLKCTVSPTISLPRG